MIKGIVESERLLKTLIKKPNRTRARQYLSLPLSPIF